MTISSALNSGLQGIQAGMEGMAKNAQNIANIAAHDSDTALGDLAESAVDLGLNELQVKASAKVVQTVSDTLGSLIDIEA